MLLKEVTLLACYLSRSVGLRPSCCRKERVAVRVQRGIFDRTFACCRAMLLLRHWSSPRVPLLLQQTFWQSMGSPILEEINGGRNKYTRRHWWVVEPNCTFRKVWDIVQAVALFYVAVVVPVRVGFEIPVVGYAYILDLCIDCYWYCDLLLNFVTGALYRCEGRLEGGLQDPVRLA